MLMRCSRWVPLGAPKSRSEQNSEMTNADLGQNCSLPRYSGIRRAPAEAGGARLPLVSRSAPTQSYFILKTRYEGCEAIPATWGLMNSWAKGASRASMCINAKAETVEKLPSFRGAFEKRRCVVPANGFYEWRGLKVRREPLWIHPADGALLLFAGLFESWQPATPVNGTRHLPLSPRQLIDCLSQFTIACRLF
jgi:putative SOS response-associated peptidase YedK